jgi:acetyl-CoA carboxylase biotin carboxyl carrier protein
MDIDTQKIRELADLAIEKNLAELIVQDGEKAVTIKLPGFNVQHVVHPQAQHVYAPPAPPPVHGLPESSSAAQTVQAEKPAADDKLVKVTSPMVGTYYAAPSPDSPPYVAVGQTISKGQTVCIIEAMKMMNELESEVSGKIVKILVENGKPVEFGQVLMLVDP